jgi:CPA1 family monovalent cation:H+ antiporter
LAGVLTIPLTLNDGTAFPARDLAIFLAAGVIITSLILASIGLPLLLRGLIMPAEPSRQAEEDRARVIAAHAALEAIENTQHRLGEGRNDVDVYAAAGARIMDLYRERIDSRTLQGGLQGQMQLYAQVDRDLRLAGLKAERDAIFRLARDRAIGSAVAQKLIRELDLLEIRYR